MKKVILTTYLLLIALIGFAQTSDKGFSFQGYAIDPDGKALAGTGVTVEFTITDPNTSAAVSEEHQLTTDGFGVFHAVIGDAPSNNIELENLNFGVNYTLQVRVKKTSGGSYTTISNGPMLAVPYAQHAVKATHADNGVPVGTIVAFGGHKDSVPDGWLLCDGSLVSSNTFPKLNDMLGGAWGVSGTSFYLPDLRGRFLRGVDEGQGRDPDAASRVESNPNGFTGDAVGTLQGDAFKQHNHGVTQSPHGHSYKDVTFTEDKNLYSSGYVTSVDKRGCDDSSIRSSGSGEHVGRYRNATTASTSVIISIDNRGNAETRPVNAAVYYIIKY